MPMSAADSDVIADFGGARNIEACESTATGVSGATYDRGALLGEAFVLLADLHVEDLARWVSA